MWELIIWYNNEEVENIRTDAFYIYKNVLEFTAEDEEMRTYIPLNSILKFYSHSVGDIE